MYFFSTQDGFVLRNLFLVLLYSNSNTSSNTPELENKNISFWRFLLSDEQCISMRCMGTKKALLKWWKQCCE